MNKISILILTIVLLVSCTPKYLVPIKEDDAKKISEIVNLMMPYFYAISPSGEAHFQGGYFAWNEKGITMFIKK